MNSIRLVDVSTDPADNGKDCPVRKLGRESIAALRKSFTENSLVLMPVTKHLALKGYGNQPCDRWDTAKAVAGTIFDLLSDNEILPRFRGDTIVKPYFDLVALSMDLANGNIRKDKNDRYILSDDIVIGTLSVDQIPGTPYRASGLTPKLVSLPYSVASQIRDKSRTQPKLQFGRVARTMIDMADISENGAKSAIALSDDRSMKKLVSGLAELVRVMSRKGAFTRFMKKSAHDKHQLHLNKPGKRQLSAKSILDCTQSGIIETLSLIRYGCHQEEILETLLSKPKNLAALADKITSRIIGNTFVFLPGKALRTVVEIILVIVACKNGYPILDTLPSELAKEQNDLIKGIVSLVFEKEGDTPSWNTQKLEHKANGATLPFHMASIVDKKRRPTWNLGISILTPATVDKLDKKVKTLLARNVPKKKVRSLLTAILSRNNFLTTMDIAGNKSPFIRGQWEHDVFHGLSSLTIPAGISRQLASNIVSIILSEAQGETNIWGAIAKVSGITKRGSDLKGISGAKSFNDLASQTFSVRNGKMLAKLEKRIGSVADHYIKTATAMGQMEEVTKVLSKIPKGFRLTNRLSSCKTVAGNIRIGILPRNDIYGILGSGVPGVCIRTSSGHRHSHISTRGMKNLVVFADHGDHIRIRLWGLLVPAFNDGKRCLVLNNLQGHVSRHREETKAAILHALGSLPCQVFTKNHFFNAISIDTGTPEKKWPDLKLMQADRLDFAYDHKTLSVTGPLHLVPHVDI